MRTFKTHPDEYLRSTDTCDSSLSSLFVVVFTFFSLSTVRNRLEASGPSLFDLTSFYASALESTCMYLGLSPSLPTFPQLASIDLALCSFLPVLSRCTDGNSLHSFIYFPIHSFPSLSTSFFILVPSALLRCLTFHITVCFPYPQLFFFL